MIKKIVFVICVLTATLFIEGCSSNDHSSEILRLKELKTLLDEGAITQTEYDKLKSEILEGVLKETPSKKSSKSNLGGHDYVDLGLPSGTKWATYNVGATKPTEYGDYFAWGETKPKEDYSRQTYKWCTVDADGILDKITKYNKDSDYGTVDDRTVLEAADDAATANWGNAWRMPTRAEQDELREGCDWEWVEDFNGSGVNGKLGTSKTNGNTIFLPAAGDRDGTDLFYVGYRGYYWSSSLYELGSLGAYSLHFIDGGIDWCYDYRCNGLSVRAVSR